MTEIARLTRNGLAVASLFSGAGGSSLGYKMAGFQVVAACDFVESARATYAANFPGTPVTFLDVRKLEVPALLDLCGKERGELDVLDGSPPCASFSGAGKGAKGWGETKKYSDVEQRTDDLFYEFARLVEGVRPKVFVAENVAGLVRGNAWGKFLLFRRALEEAGYSVSVRMLDAQWLGVPQARQRVIFVGTRKDLGIAPSHPSPFPWRYSLAEALEGLPSPTAEELAEVSIEKYAIGREWKRTAEGTNSDRYFSLARPLWSMPCPTVTATTGNVGAAGVCHPTEPRKFTARELRRICSFPDDFVLEGDYQHQVERMGRAVPPLMMRAVASHVAGMLAASPGA
jgi:DNA (cytosine-5)-methyltransferase 1